MNIAASFEPQVYDYIEQTPYGEIGSESWAMKLYDMPEMRLAHLHAERLAEDILGRKKQLIIEDFELAEVLVEKPTDAIGNHRRVADLRRSKAAPEAIEKAEREAYWDSYLGFGEKMQKLRRDLPEPRIFDVRKDGTIVAGDVPLKEMYANAITPLSTSVETLRRQAEFVNICDFESILRQGLDESHNFVVLSLIPNDKATLKSSYVPEIKKMMVNFISFYDSDEGKKMQLQIGAINGLEFSLNDANGLLQELDITTAHDDLDETGILGTIIPVPKDGFSDVTDFIALMDEFDDKNLFMGEVVPEDYPKNYQQEYAVAREIYKKFEVEAWEMDQYAYELVEQGVRPEEAQSLIDERQKILARKICELDPAQARTTFSEISAGKFEELALMRETGELEAARDIEEDLDENLESLAGCGGGACDLYQELTVAEKVEVRRKLGFDADAKNGYARCGGCGARTLMQKGVGKAAVYGCMSCGSRSDTSKAGEDKREISWLDKQMGKTKDPVTEEVDSTPQATSTVDVPAVDNTEVEQRASKEGVVVRSDVQ